MNKYSSYVLFLLISVLVVILYANSFGPMAGLQQDINDMVNRVTAPNGNRPNVVLVTIDRKALNTYGDWPWNRDLVADLMAAVASAEPKSMLVDIDFQEDVSQDSAGYTKILADQMSWMHQVVIPFDIALSTYRSGKTDNPDHLFNFSMNVDNPLGLMSEDASLQVRKVFLPAEKILRSEPWLGFDYNMPDADRVLRYQPLIMNYEGYYYPSTALAAAALYLDVSPSEINIVEGKEIQLGDKRTIPINAQGEYYIRHSPKDKLLRYSAATVLEDGFRFDLLKGKLVVVALDDYGETEMFSTPAAPDTPDYLVKASVAENIINDDMLTVKGSGSATDMAILFAIGALCAFALPQVNKLYRFFILILGMVVLANVNYFMVSVYNTVPQTVYILLELLLFAIASPFLDSIMVQHETEKTELPKKTKKPPKIKADSMGIDDFAQAPVREITPSASDPENVNTRAMTQPSLTASASKGTTADARNQASPAQSNGSFDHQAIDIDANLSETTQTPASGIEQSMPDDDSREAPLHQMGVGGPQIVSPNESGPFGDVPEMGITPDIISLDDDDPRPVARKSEQPEPELSLEDSRPQTKAFDSGQMNQTGEIKNLGRYQVIDVLGKGAMGLVYRGVDPAINRPVALKTIRLDFVNDPEEMEELRERLHREAQAAGKLSHTNIVTIYDVGSEGHLQYIAMEYLEGQTLEEMIKKKVQFNYRIIAQIIVQICSALEYAHEQGIVHRDIKPANIMVLSDYRVKVMDYGIARVDSASMTKTGIAMGTPNYISPEQLQGKSIDRRADLFSLGVVMYELLLGKRPFRGENITSLIYAVLNHTPDKPSDVNPQIPLLFDHIIGRALKKDPRERYQKASEIMTDLADFVTAFSAKS